MTHSNASSSPLSPKSIEIRALYRTKRRPQPRDEGTHQGGYGARQDRPHTSPTGPQRRRRVCRYIGIHDKGGRSFGHGPTGCRRASEGSMTWRRFWKQ